MQGRSPGSGFLIRLLTGERAAIGQGFEARSHERRYEALRVVLPCPMTPMPRASRETGGTAPQRYGGQKAPERATTARSVRSRTRISSPGDQQLT